MDRVDKAVEPPHNSGADSDTLCGEDFERLDCRIHRELGIVEPIHKNGFASRKARRDQLVAIGERAPVLRVWGSRCVSI